MDDEIYKNKIGKSYFCKIFLFTFVTFKNIKLKILKLLIPLFCLDEFIKGMNYGIIERPFVSYFEI